MTSIEPTVFVVDDDELARGSVCALIHSIGLKAESFSSGEEFLNKYTKDRPGCLVTDLRMSGMSGLDLQEQLVQRKIMLPVIILTAYARTTTTVRAVKAGAVTVLDKPYVDDDLLDAIRAALAKCVAESGEHLRRQKIRDQLAQLSPMERIVLDMLVQGHPNKAIATAMDVSVRTVENRRQDLYAKMQVNSIAELIRIAVEAEIVD
jgi:two-component system, LuxR family, response regulator FixJ